MLDRQKLRQDTDLVRNGAKKKNIHAPIDEFVSIDAEWRSLRTQLDEIKAEQNRISKSIGALMAQGEKQKAEEAKNQATQLKDKISELEDKERILEKKLLEIELEIPNLPHESVPVGKDEKDNVVVETWGEKPQLNFTPKAHWDIATYLGIIDFEAGAKISGSGFIVYKGLGAKLQRALINFMLDYHIEKNNYTEIYPPFIVTRDSLTGTGQLPKFEEDLYYMERDDVFLIPTAEVPVTNLHREEILDIKKLPINYVAFSGCFRREAGAAGKDTRGLLRVHQFDKVELVKFCTPESSYTELEKLRRDAQSILQELGLHFRVTELCTGELSFANAKCYDLEVWSPGVEKFLEISSASNFEAFQARRANIRYRPDKGSKLEFVHTLNASGVALPRLVAAILETYQQEDGSVIVPEALRGFMGAEVINPV